MKLYVRLCIYYYTVTVIYPTSRVEICCFCELTPCSDILGGFLVYLSLVMFYQNLCSFFYSKPPLCVFLLSLLSFSIITFSLSIYVQHNDRVANIDVLDWNRLLLEMSELKYCLCRDKCHCQESVHLNEGAMLGTRVRRDLNQVSYHLLH